MFPEVAESVGADLAQTKSSSKAAPPNRELVQTKSSASKTTPPNRDAFHAMFAL